MRSFNFLLTISVVLFFVSARFFFLYSCRAAPEKTITAEITTIDTARIKKFGTDALVYCQKKNFNTDFYFLADMSMHSGKNRFLVWSFKENKILKKALVTHGCGNSGWSSDESRVNPVFSNTPESHCSSLGKYKIGERGYSQFGMHVKYLLHGLDTSNSNALARTIVLHSWEIIPDEETYPEGAPESWGCPAVSNNFMRQLDTLLSTAEKPTLLWMVK